MNTQKQVILTILLVFYLIIIAFTKFSFVGFWTDIIISIVFTLIVLVIIYRHKTKKNWLTVTLRTITVICAIVLSLFFIGSLVFPFGWDFSKLRSFYFIRVNGKLFNAYFKPVGSYSGGEGNFWITESPSVFPIIEKEVYYKHAVLYNFSLDSFEGKSINNYEMVKSYIQNEIIDKHQ